MKRYNVLEYEAHLSSLGLPMLEVDSVPVLRQLHDEINFIIMNREYYDEVVDSLSQVLSGNLHGYDFGHEVYYFECDKEECDVYEWDKKIGLLRTQDVYDMLKYFQDYRDNYYASRQK